MWDEAEKLLLKDEYIGPLIEKFGPCKIKPRVHVDYFQSLIGEIIGQQLSGRVADVIYERLKKKIKRRLTPQKILLLSDQDLRDCGMAWAKVRSIKDLSERVRDQNLQIRKLNELSDDEVMKELVAVRGIGRWTAEMFLMFSLGRKDIFPDDDLGIRKGFQKVIGKKLEGEKLAKFALRWKPYRTVAAWYLWASLDND
jgi:DNA-3-methyladenine glycosylase II